MTSALVACATPNDVRYTATYSNIGPTQLELLALDATVRQGYEIAKFERRVHDFAFITLPLRLDPSETVDVAFLVQLVYDTSRRRRSGSRSSSCHAHFVTIARCRRASCRRLRRCGHARCPTRSARTRVPTKLPGRLRPQVCHSSGDRLAGPRCKFAMYFHGARQVSRESQSTATCSPTCSRVSERCDRCAQRRRRALTTPA